jgi:UTP--glucose-1-phosphate uridylyltransferase
MAMQVQKVVIPVAGAGTRLLPVTKCQPKEMLPVGRKPVVQYVVEEAEAAGLRQILFVTGRQKTSIEDHFDKDPALAQMLSQSGKSDLLEELEYEELPVSFFFVRQREPKGLADAIATARDFVGAEPFVVSLGDSIIAGKGGSAPLLKRMIECHLAHEAACTIALEEVPLESVHRYGVVRPAEAAKQAARLPSGALPTRAAAAPPAEVFPIADLVEKPLPEQAPSNLAIAARYVFNPEIFEAIERTVPDRRGELQITDSIRILVQQGRPVWGVMLGPNSRRYDIGNFETYFLAFADFALADEKYGYTLRQHLYRRFGMRPEG